MPTLENSSSLTGNAAPGYVVEEVDNLEALYRDSNSLIGSLDGNQAM